MEFLLGCAIGILFGIITFICGFLLASYGTLQSIRDDGHFIDLVNGQWKIKEGKEE